MISRNNKSFFAHESTCLDPGCSIGKNSKIWHFTHVSAGASIGEGCTIGQNVYVGPKVKIGNRVKIQNNVSLPEGVILEDDVFCSPSVVFTNVIRPRGFISRKHEFQKTIVKRGASLGANAIILCGRTLGAYCFIAAGAVVTKDVLDYALMIGIPARKKGWVCQCAATLTPNLVCPACSLVYQKLRRGEGIKSKV